MSLAAACGAGGSPAVLVAAVLAGGGGRTVHGVVHILGTSRVTLVTDSLQWWSGRRWRRRRWWWRWRRWFSDEVDGATAAPAVVVMPCVFQ